MNRIKWLTFLLLLFAQAIFSTQGGSAELSRTLAVTQQQNEGARVAIVIGNSRYPQGSLPNPKNDATAIATALKKLGFDVDLKIDATKSDMNEIFKRFARKAEKATVAAMFYAGHGLQVNGANYIVPIDASPQSERDLKRELIKMDDVIDDMGDARVKLVFFDACRDNPLSRSFSRGGSRGMAPPVEATGTLISFATKHGNTAADGEGDHSPYTSALLAAMENSGGVEIEQMLRKVQQGVKQATKGQQEPWRYGSLDGDFYFKMIDPAETSRAQQEQVDKAIADAMRRANEQAAREKAELQQATKAQQEAAERAAQDALKRAAEQSAREKAELQQAVRTQQEAAERAAQDAIRRANEQAARERAEFRQTMKAQQDAAERASQEALKRANEQAARERAELQQSMEKMLKEALARQNAQIEADRTARDAADGKVARAAAPEQKPPPALKPERVEPAAPQRVIAAAAPAAPEPAKPVQVAPPAAALAPAVAVPGVAAVTASPANSQPTKPIQVASIAPTAATLAPVTTAPLAVISGESPSPGDEWEYTVKDHRFDRARSFVERVKAFAADTGVLEEFLLDEKPKGVWVFDGKPAIIGVPFGMGVMFSSHWSGKDVSEPTLLWSRCSSDLRCSTKLEKSGQEKITVPAGKFETTKLDIAINVTNVTGTGSGWIIVTVWYSDELRRVIRQTLRSGGFFGRWAEHESIELAAIRKAPTVGVATH